MARMGLRWLDTGDPNKCSNKKLVNIQIPELVFYLSLPISIFTYTHTHTQRKPSSLIKDFIIVMGTQSF